MSKSYDFSNIRETSGYGPGKHTVRFDRWFFDETKKGTPYLQINFIKDGVAHSDDKPFTRLRFFFSEKSGGIAKRSLHLLCDKMGIEYDGSLLDTSESILQLGEQVRGREIEIELVGTGVINEKGYEYLEPIIAGVNDWLGKKETDSGLELDTSPRLEDQYGSDVPF